MAITLGGLRDNWVISLSGTDLLILAEMHGGCPPLRRLPIGAQDTILPHSTTIEIVGLCDSTKNTGYRRGRLHRLAYGTVAAAAGARRHGSRQPLQGLSPQRARGPAAPDGP